MKQIHTNIKDNFIHEDTEFDGYAPYICTVIIKSQWSTLLEQNVNFEQSLHDDNGTTKGLTEDVKFIQFEWCETQTQTTIN